MIERDKQNELTTQAFKRLFDTDDGKFLMEFLEKRCNVHISSVCLPNPNALQTMFAEGKRKVYLDIMWYLKEGYKKQNGLDEST